MAVRCPACGRLTRDEGICEWCRKEIPAEVRRLAAASASSRPPVDEPDGPDETPGAAVQAPFADTDLAAAEAAGAEVDVISREEAEAAAAARPETERADEAAAAVEPEVVLQAAEERQDNETLVILLLILLQLGLTLYLGRLSSWWSATGILWLAVGYGVKERASWSLALPLVLFTLDIALLLFGIGPRERAGFFTLAPLDCLLYLLRLVIWALIWRLRDEMA